MLQWISMVSAVMLPVASILVPYMVTAHEGHDLGITVKVPLLMSPSARAGEKTYRDVCSSCHGKYAEGTHKGPSLIPYDKAHHPDGQFVGAIQSGVDEHHWNFGDMPPIDGLNDSEMHEVIAYVRELQIYNADLKNGNPNRN